MALSRAQIIATIGPASMQPEVLRDLITNGMDIARINFSWVETAECTIRISIIKDAMRAADRVIPIIIDLPGPRIQHAQGHTYAADAPDALTTKDHELLLCAIAADVSYIALSFVSGTKEIETARALITAQGSNTKIIAKIERAIALTHLDAIIAASDAIMVARGDLGEDIPFDEVPFVQTDIIKRCNSAGKPVIVATQMLFSMVTNETPTRAEVTDVATAILSGADAVMLSDETAMGAHPVKAVEAMERILQTTERHAEEKPYHPL